MDIKLTADGDIDLSKYDFQMTDSVRQKIMIRLRWILNEWRWNPDEGLPYFDEILKKDPDVDTIEAEIRSKIWEVTEVTEVKDVSVDIDPATRVGTISFTAVTDYETIREEVSSNG